MKYARFITPVALGIGISVLLSGIILCTATVRSAPLVRVRMESKRQDLARLKQLEQRLIPYQQAYAQAESADAGNTIPITSLLKEYTSLKAEDIRTEPEELNDNWQRIRTTISFNESSIPEIMAFVDNVTTKPIPWRLARCDIRASNQSPGHGHVTIQLEQLRRP
ncbi:MAG: hypothetical protein ISS35_03120 [Kiritimatiellae bacterium]|nr:hypothetical protein [Kiritimatiellia bacterium]